jgi:predicted kinase
MLTVFIFKGAPASGKSSAARELMRKEPGKWRRINNDALREAMDFGVYSAENEKTLRRTREFLLKDFLKSGFNVVVDNVNAGKRHFEDICKWVASLNIDVQVVEKIFYCPLEELLRRDGERTGNAKVGEKIVERWFKELGGNQFKNYQVKHEIFTKRTTCAEGEWTPMEQDENLDKCVVYDLDGSMALISHRNPYDASNCIKDTPHKHVVDMCKLHHNTGHKVFFFSGREDKHREVTEEWLNIHFGYPYELHMRETNNNEDDAKLKRRLFETHIKNKHCLVAWVDDRLKVCRFVFEAGLPLFRVGSPDADF